MRVCLYKGTIAGKTGAGDVFETVRASRMRRNSNGSIAVLIRKPSVTTAAPRVARKHLIKYLQRTIRVPLLRFDFLIRTSGSLKTILTSMQTAPLTWPC